MPSWSGDKFEKLAASLAYLFFEPATSGSCSGSNQVVHSAYWPMDLVEATDAPIACLYGHESIPHSSGYDNRKCSLTPLTPQVLFARELFCHCFNHAASSI